MSCTACAAITQTNLGFANLVPCAATIVYSIPCAGVHRRTGQQVSGTARLCDPVRERENKVFGKRSARLLKFFITARLPGRSPGPRATRLQRRLLRAATVAAQAAAVAAPTTTSPTTVRYVCHVPICCFTMAVLVDVLLLFMLINTSSIFEFNMLLAVAIMFTILELIMEIMPNNPTTSKSSPSRLSACTG